MKFIFITLLIFIIPIITFSQKVFVKDINLDVKNDDIIVNYNLIGVPNTQHFVDFILIDNQKNVYIPENAVGSIGSNIKNGKNTISFNLQDQDFPLDRELSPAFILDNNYKNGSRAALLSVMIPGLGDYFVENPKKMIIKPYYRTIAVGGFLALAFIAEINSEDSKNLEKVVWVEGEYVRWNWVPGHYDTATYKTKPTDWLFRNDKEVFLGVAAAIWAFDIFWVYSKGQQNNRIRKALSNKKSKLELSSNGISYKINLD